MVMGKDLECEHIIQHTDEVLQNCTPETYIILLANDTPINSIRKEITKQTHKWIIILLIK